MTPITACAGKRLALFGLGGSGLATADALKAGGAEVLVWDDAPQARERAAERGHALVDLASLDWRTIASLVLSPGVPLTHPEPHWSARLARAAGVEIIGDIELFCRERRKIARHAPMIAITGTNGKSTTTALTAHLFRSAGRSVAMGGNIGTAILALPPPAQNRLHVIEVSSYQIDLSPSLDPTIGMLLNVTPDHLDRHGSMENYAAVKERMVEKAEWALIGIDDAISSDIFERAMQFEARHHYAARPAGRKYPVSVRQSLATGVSAEGDWLIMRPYAGKEHVLGSIAGLSTLRGRHNAQNACFAAGAADILGLWRQDAAVIQRGLSSFAGLPHRMEQVGRLGHVLFINDSKATNADSTEKALSSFRHVHWILGGRPKAGGIEALKPHFSRILHAYLIGEATDIFAATLQGKVPFTRCGTLDKAVAAAAEAAGAGDAAGEAIVLFSPACASFDQFKNFEVRGEHFRDLVGALGARGTS
jgi:UDP-N-acetylmuramoylalanine--D-glutamate ligase